MYGMAHCMTAMLQGKVSMSNSPGHTVPSVKFGKFGKLKLHVDRLVAAWCTISTMVAVKCCTCTCTLHLAPCCLIVICFCFSACQYVYLFRLKAMFRAPSFGGQFAFLVARHLYFLFFVIIVLLQLANKICSVLYKLQCSKLHVIDMIAHSITSSLISLVFFFFVYL